MPDHGGARDVEARLDVAELAVAVRGLVEVHEVEVDLRPGQFDVRLRVQVQQRLLQRVESGDPHLRGAEGVHPGDQPDHRSSALASRIARRIAALSVSTLLPHQRDRDRSTQHPGDLARLLGHLAEGLLAVEALAAGEEPDLEGLQVGDDRAALRGSFRLESGDSGALDLEAGAITIEVGGESRRRRAGSGWTAASSTPTKTRSRR